MHLSRLAVAASIVGATFAGIARADGDPLCIDYFYRHLRKDLRVEAITFHEVEHGYQEGHVQIKNWGEVAMPGDPARGRMIRLKIGVHAAEGHLVEGLAPLATTDVRIFLNPNVLQPCDVVTIALDTRKTAGQWGCAVFSNDVRDVQVTVPGVSCE